MNRFSHIAVRIAINTVVFTLVLAGLWLNGSTFDATSFIAGAIYGLVAGVVQR